MPQLTLYFSPRSCSRAALIALEQIGVSFDARVVAFAKMEQNAPEYRALNPKGKVPTLVADGIAITESPAIFSWLDETYAEAGLLPRVSSALGRTEVLSDLCWATSALHGLIARLRYPVMFCARREAWDEIFDTAAKLMAGNFALIEQRLTARDWWHGQWSVQDAYLFWVWTRAADAGFDVLPYRRFAAHAARMHERPAVQRALQRESDAEKDLAARGALVNVPPIRPAVAVSG